jgi:hypothetical protein
MIVEDIYSYLTDDATLKTLLNADTQNPKIYPNYCKASEMEPFVIYRSLNPGTSPGGVLNEEVISFEIVASDYEKVIDISVRLNELLDFVKEGDIPSADYRIFYSEKTGGSDFSDVLRRHVRMVNYLFKFKKRSG